jgi:hypothetical protein
MRLALDRGSAADGLYDCNRSSWRVIWASESQMPGVNSSRRVHMTEGSRFRTAVIVFVLAMVMGLGGGLLASTGGVLGIVGFVLVAFGMMGIGQAGAIGVGYLNPRSAEDDDDDEERPVRERTSGESPSSR